MPDNDAPKLEDFLDPPAETEQPAPDASPRPRNFDKPSPGGQWGARRDYGGHTGVDFPWKRGEGVGAARAGRVTFAGPRGGYGNRVEVAHDDGTTTTYSHLSAIDVARGDDLDEGSLVGRVGNTGDSHGDHLHYEVLRGGRKVNPLGTDYVPVRGAKSVLRRAAQSADDKQSAPAFDADILNYLDPADETDQHAAPAAGHESGHGGQAPPPSGWDDLPPSASDLEDASFVESAARDIAPKPNAASRALERQSLPVDLPEQLPELDPYHDRVEPGAKPGSVRVVDERVEAERKTQVARARRKVELLREREATIRAQAAQHKDYIPGLDPDTLSLIERGQDFTFNRNAPPGSFNFGGPAGMPGEAERVARTQAAARYRGQLTNVVGRRQAAEAALTKLLSPADAAARVADARRDVQLHPEGQLDRAAEIAGGAGGRAIGEAVTPTADDADRMFTDALFAPTREERERGMAAAEAVARQPLVKPATLTPEEQSELEGQIAFDESRPAYQRVLAQPTEALVGDLFSQVGNVLARFGVAQRPADFLRQRGLQLQLEAQAEHAKNDLPGYLEETGKYLYGAGLNISELIILQRTTGASLPTVMGGQALASNLDKDVRTRERAVASAMLFGKALEAAGGLRRLPSMAVFGGSELAQGLYEGDDAKKVVARTAGGALLGGAFGDSEAPSLSGRAVSGEIPVPEPIRAALARRLGYEPVTVMSEDGRYAAVDFNPKTSDFITRPITAEEASQRLPRNPVEKGATHLEMTPLGTLAQQPRFVRVPDEVFDGMLPQTARADANGAAAEAEGQDFDARRRVRTGRLLTEENPEPRDESVVIDALTNLRSAPDEESFGAAVRAARAAGASEHEIDAALRPAAQAQGDESHVTSDERPTPEAPEALAAQLDALAGGRRAAVVVTPGEEMPAVPSGMKSVRTTAGTVIYDPKQVGKDAVRRAVREGRVGALAGHVEESPAEASHVVVARDPETGAEIQSSYVSSVEKATEQARAFAGQHPGAEIVAGGPGLEQKVLEERAAKNGQKPAKILPAKSPAASAEEIKRATPPGGNGGPPRVRPSGIEPPAAEADKNGGGNVPRDVRATGEGAKASPEAVKENVRRFANLPEPEAKEAESLAESLRHRLEAAGGSVESRSAEGGGARFLTSDFKQEARRITGAEVPKPEAAAGGDIPPGPEESSHYWIPRDEAEYERVKQRLRDKFRSFGKNAFRGSVYGLDVVAELLPDLARLGAYHVRNGAVEFAEWSKAMAEDLGEGIKPHLRKIFAEAKKLVSSAEEEAGNENGLRAGGGSDERARRAAVADEAAAVRDAGAAGATGRVDKARPRAGSPSVRPVNGPDDLDAVRIPTDAEKLAEGADNERNEAADDSDNNARTANLHVASSEMALPEDGASNPARSDDEVESSDGGAGDALRDTNAERSTAEDATTFEPVSHTNGEGHIKGQAGTERERAFPNTLEAAGLEGGEDRSYNVVTNADAVAHAEHVISEKGTDGAAEYLKHQEQTDAYSTALAVKLIGKLQDEADAAQGPEARRKLNLAVEVASDISRRLTRQGQAVQAAQIASRMSPERVVMTAQKMVESRDADARLTPAQVTELKEAASRTKAAEDKALRLSKTLRQVRTALKEATGSDELPERPKRQRAKPRHVRRMMSLADRFAKLEADARMRMAARATVQAPPTQDLGQIGASIIPQDLADLAIIGAAKMAKGAVNRGLWFDEMADEYGREIRRYLPTIRREAGKLYRSEKAKLRREVLAYSVTGGRPDDFTGEEIDELIQARARRLREKAKDERHLAIEVEGKSPPERQHFKMSPSAKEGPEAPGWMNAGRAQKEGPPKHTEEAPPVQGPRLSEGTGPKEGPRPADALTREVAAVTGGRDEMVRDGALLIARRGLDARRYAEVMRSHFPANEGRVADTFKEAYEAVQTARRNLKTAAEVANATGGKPEDYTAAEIARMVKDRRAAQEEARKGAQDLARAFRRLVPPRPEDYLTKWRRMVALSSVATLGKLSAAALWRTFTTPMEEAIGYGLSKAMPKLAAKAPREGGASLRAERDAFVQFFRRATYGDIWDKLRTGQHSLDREYGHYDFEEAGPALWEFFGRLHGAFKTEVQRNEFFRSLAKRTARALKKGEDVSDLVVQTRLGTEAYLDSKRAILMSDNFATDIYKAALARAEKLGVHGRTVATTARLTLPIVKVPTNYVFEASSHLPGVGAAKGLGRIILSKGVERMTPEEADYTLRAFKKQLLGLGLLALGFFGYAGVKAGGYYVKGEKRKEGDLQPGEMELFGVRIPRLLSHSPALEAVQWGATVRNVMERMKGKNGAVAEGLYQATKGLAEEAPFVDAPLRAGETFRDTRSVGKAAGEFAKDALIPPDVQRVAKMRDEDSAGETVRRKPVGFVETFEGGVPGLRQNVPAVIDAPEPVRKLYERHDIMPYRAPSKLKVAGHDHELTEDERLKLEKDVQQESYKRVGALLDPTSEAALNYLARFNSLPADRQKEVVQSIQREAAEFVRGKFKAAALRKTVPRASASGVQARP